jgi:recombinational DNA repair ATPase RecF
MWNEQLLKYGTELIIMRSEFIKELNPLIAEIHAGLSGGKETLSIAYEPNVSPENFRIASTWVAAAYFMQLVSASLKLGRMTGHRWL